MKSHLPQVADLAPDLTPVAWIEETGEVLYALQPKQLEAFNLTPFGRDPDEEGATNIGYGGAAGGGKSYLTRAVHAVAALQWPGSTSIIFRKTEREVLENHVNKFRQEVPEKLANGKRLYTWNGAEMCVIWYNGSRTYFGYLKIDDDVFRYQGPEYDLMTFEESTHYSSFQVTWLTGNRLRSTVPKTEDFAGTVPFVLYPSNPGGKGHAWYKRLFIERNFHADDGEEARDYVFIQARLADNRILRERDPKYEKRLNRLPQPWRDWQRDGDFAAGAGGAFAEIDAHVHVVKPFPIPHHWLQFGAFDWGYHHPFSFGWYAVDEDGNVYKIETVTGFKNQPHEIADKILLKVPVRQLRYISAGHDLWSQQRARGDQGETLWEFFAGRGIVCQQADTNRIQGYQNMIRYFAWKTVDEGKAGVPRFRLFDTKQNRACLTTIENMVNDDVGGEDVRKVDADDHGDGGDDPYDETRYALMSVRMKGDSADEPEWTDSWSKEALAYERESKMRVTDEPVDSERDFHPEFGRIF